MHLLQKVSLLPLWPAKGSSKLNAEFVIYFLSRFLSVEKKQTKKHLQATDPFGGTLNSEFMHELQRSLTNHARTNQH